MDQDNVVKAAFALYFAGNWTTDELSEEQEERLWGNLRDALGIPPGTGTSFFEIVGDKYGT